MPSEERFIGSDLNYQALHIDSNVKALPRSLSKHVAKN